MKSFGAPFLRPDALPGVDHMRGMQYQNSPKSYFLSQNSIIQLHNLCEQLLHKTSKKKILNRPLVASYDIPG